MISNGRSVAIDFGLIYTKANEILLTSSVIEVFPFKMSATELEALDSSLEYNDDEEDYESEKGYWITDDIESGKVTSITVFVPEVLEEDFFEYKWIERYL